VGVILKIIQQGFKVGRLDAYDLPIGTVMSRLARGRLALASLLIDNASAPQARAKTECRLRRVI